jgi:hypothetical protein
MKENSRSFFCGGGKCGDEAKVVADKDALRESQIDALLVRGQLGDGFVAQQPNLARLKARRAARHHDPIEPHQRMLK